ncbi:MAG: hypothetical protein IT576_02125 [Verrucomicrobiales bacterium]|nr:hypothetical protein [Verrucomicrobiales bacterium]
MKTNKIKIEDTDQLIHALRTAAKPKMEGYFVDLATDEKVIRLSPGIPFIHFTRKFGTWMSLMHPADHKIWPPKGIKIPYIFGEADRSHILRAIVDCARYSQKNGPTLLALYFDGETLSQITTARAVEIADEHVKSVERIWSKQ